MGTGLLTMVSVVLVIKILIALAAFLTENRVKMKITRLLVPF